MKSLSLSMIRITLLSTVSFSPGRKEISFKFQIEAVCTGFWWNIVDKYEAAVNGYFVMKIRMLML